MPWKFFHVMTLYPEFGETELNRFIAAHSVLEISRQLVVDGQQSHWAFAVQYDAPSEAQPRKPAVGKVDYRELLSEADFVLFDRLRALRKRLSDEQGVPPYALFNNDQLCQMVQRRTRSLADLQAIPGIGAARVEKYGAAFLAALSGAPNTPAGSGDEANPG